MNTLNTLNSITPSSVGPAFALSRDGFGRLVLRLGGQADITGHVGVTPVRAFPLAAPGEGVSLIGVDGHELLWIEHFDALDDGVKTLLEEEFAAREFAPKILQLLHVSTFSTPSVWQVDTDRGPTEFTLAGEENIRRIANGALLITSASGVHFRVADMSALDRASRRLMERFL